MRSGREQAKVSVNIFLQKLSLKYLRPNFKGEVRQRTRQGISKQFPQKCSLKFSRPNTKYDSLRLSGRTKKQGQDQEYTESENGQCWNLLNLEHSMGARNRVGIEMSYRAARLHRLAESIPGLLKSFKIPSLVWGFGWQTDVDRGRKAMTRLRVKDLRPYFRSGLGARNRDGNE